MFKLVLYMTVLGALLKVAKSDFRCFADKLRNIGGNLNFQIIFARNVEATCQSGQKELIDSLQHAIDECSVPVTTDSMKSLLEEFCQPGSELQQTFKETRTCLSSNLGLSDTICKIRLQNKDPYLLTKQECLKFNQDTFTCFAETMGNPCGEKAVKALKHVYKVSVELTNGLCKEVASRSSRNRMGTISGSWSVSGHLHWVAIAVVGLITVIV